VLFLLTTLHVSRDEWRVAGDEGPKLLVFS